MDLTDVSIVKMCAIYKHHADPHSVEMKIMVLPLLPYVMFFDIFRIFYGILGDMLEEMFDIHYIQMTSLVSYI
jgi:hypothetical protein